MSKTIVLSIRPSFVDAIWEGRKRFEFRRVMPANHVWRVLIYESAPVSLVVGEFIVGGHLKMVVDSMWRYCESKAGISHHDFYQYFKGLRVAQCYFILTYRKYKKPFPITKFGFTQPPQNFYYIPNDFEYETE